MMKQQIFAPKSTSIDFTLEQIVEVIAKHRLAAKGIDNLTQGYSTMVEQEINHIQSICENSIQISNQNFYQVYKEWLSANIALLLNNCEDEIEAVIEERVASEYVWVKAEGDVCSYITEDDFDDLWEEGYTPHSTDKKFYNSLSEPNNKSIRRFKTTFSKYLPMIIEEFGIKQKDLTAV